MFILEYIGFRNSTQLNKDNSKTDLSLILKLLWSNILDGRQNVGSNIILFDRSNWMYQILWTISINGLVKLYLHR